jgi:hypothetical protein
VRGLLHVLLLALVPGVLDEKAVVRLFVAGQPVDAIAHEIATRPGTYDLSPEMLAELRLAGLPETLIDAMRRTQPAPAPAPTPAPEPAPAAAPAPARIRITLSGDLKLELAAEIDAERARAWGLTRIEDRQLSGAALYLACTSATHVPDYWRNASPLGGDLQSMPRHEMLSFIPLQLEAQGKDRRRATLPASFEVVLSAGEPHDLTLGLALGAGGRYFRLADGSQAGFVATAGAAELRARITRKAGRPPEIELLR